MIVNINQSKLYYEEISKKIQELYENIPISKSAITQSIPNHGIENLQLTI